MRYAIFNKTRVDANGLDGLGFATLEKVEVLTPLQRGIIRSLMKDLPALMAWAHTQIAPPSKDAPCAYKISPDSEGIEPGITFIQQAYTPGKDGQGTCHEVHAQNADVHVLLEGVEIIGLGKEPILNVPLLVRNFDTKKDVGFPRGGILEIPLRVSAGMAVVIPQALCHRPGGCLIGEPTGPIRKVVIKVPSTLKGPVSDLLQRLPWNSREHHSR